jgi:hypothetical protein
MHQALESPTPSTLGVVENRRELPGDLRLILYTRVYIVLDRILKVEKHQQSFTMICIAQTGCKKSWANIRV